jgi:hypothetical protein
VLDDIKYGADTILISLKEKYLGRKPGTKRGEADVQYKSTYLHLMVSAIMLLVLLYVYR